MNKMIIEELEKALAQKKDTLMVRLGNELNRISIPESKIVTRVVSSTKSSKSNLAILIAGCIVLLIGALSNHGTFFYVLGGLGIIAGCYLEFKNKKKTVAPIEAPFVDYVALAQQVYNECKRIHKEISSEWDAFLNDQVQSIKTGMRTSSLKQDQLSRILDEISSQSVITVSMMDVYNELTSIKDSEPVTRFISSIQGFQDKYSKEIDRAYLEQMSRYERVKAII